MPSLTLLLLALLQGERYVHPAPRLELVLPSSEWKPRDEGGQGVLAMVFTPVADMTRRCSVLRFTESFLPEGLATREQQMIQAAGKHYARVALEPGELAGHAATRWEYTIAGGTSIEWAFQDVDERWIVFQIAGTAADWEDEERRALLEAIPDTFVWSGGEEPASSSLARTPVDELRKLRVPEDAGARPFEVVRHRIEAVIVPEAHTLDALDRLTITAGAAEVKELTFYTTLVEVTEVTAEHPLQWRVDKVPEASVLVVTLEPPLPAGATFELVARTASADFFQDIEQDLVVEIAVTGQVDGSVVPALPH